MIYLDGDVHCCWFMGSGRITDSMVNRQIVLIGPMDHVHAIAAGHVIPAQTGPPWPAAPEIE